MATKSKPKNRGGRPTKSPAGPVITQVNARLTAEDLALLTALQAQEQARLDSMGTVRVRVSPADTLRIALRREAERRGLLEAPVAQAS